MKGGGDKERTNIQKENGCAKEREKELVWKEKRKKEKQNESERERERRHIMGYSWINTEKKENERVIKF